MDLVGHNQKITFITTIARYTYSVDSFLPIPDEILNRPK